MDVHQVIERNLARSFEVFALSLVQPVPGDEVVRRGTDDEHVTG